MENKYVYSEYLNSLQVKFAAGRYFNATSDWQNTETLKLNKLYYVTEGEFLLTVNQKEYIIKEGHLVMIPANMRHSYRLTKKETLKKYWCHFEAVVGMINLFDLIKTDMVVDIGRDRKLISLFRDLYKTVESNLPASAITEKAQLMLIIARYLEACKKIEPKANPCGTDLSPVIQYMKEHITDKITISELSKIVHLHPNYFIRIFKQYFGSSPQKYFSAMKIDLAKNLLQKGNISIENVAKEAGFNDIYSFSRFFKTNVGISPTRFKMNLLDN